MRYGILGLGVTLLVTVAGCADPAPEDDGGGVTWISTTGPEHCGVIEQDEVWAADIGPHIITCDVSVEGGTLSIGPGTEVLFANDVALRISEGGGTASLDVHGSAAKPVVMRGESGSGPGLHAGIEIGEFAGDINLRHMTLDSGGGFNTLAAITVTRKDIHVDHLEVTNADEVGLYFWDGAGLSADSTALTVSGTTGFPVRIDPDRADSLPAAGSDYSGNDQDAIFVHHSQQSEAAVSGPRRWEDLGVPYYADASIVLEGGAGSVAVLTLEAGVTVMFGGQSTLVLSDAGGAAGLVTEGTADLPVTLTSAGGQGRGGWPGVVIDDDADDANLRLSHTVIEYAGGFNTLGCLMVNDAEVWVDHLTLRGCEDAGFRFWGSARFADGSSTLQVQDSPLPGEIWAYQAHTVPEEGIDLTGNDVDALFATWGHNEPIASEVTWGDLGVPYRLEDGLELDGSAGSAGILNLVPGLTLEFGVDTTLAMSWAGGGSGLRAVGTAAAPILFTSAYAKEPGAWGGIEIHDNAYDADTVFEHAVIEYGGGFNSIANLELSDASPTLSNVVIAHSEQWGVYLWPGAAPSLTSVSYQGNLEGDVGSL